MERSDFRRTGFGEPNEADVEREPMLALAESGELVSPWSVSDFHRTGFGESNEDDVERVPMLWRLFLYWVGSTGQWAVKREGVSKSRSDRQ